MRKILTTGGAAMCFLGATAAIASSSGGHGKTLEVFFRCSPLPSLWHSVASWNWAFVC